MSPYHRFLSCIHRRNDTIEQILNVIWHEKGRKIDEETLRKKLPLKNLNVIQKNLKWLVDEKIIGHADGRYFILEAA